MYETILELRRARMHNHTHLYVLNCVPVQQYPEFFSPKILRDPGLLNLDRLEEQHYKVAPTALNSKHPYQESGAKQQLSTLGTFPPEADQPLAEAHFKL